MWWTDLETLANVQEMLSLRKENKVTSGVINDFTCKQPRVGVPKLCQYTFL